MARKLNSLSEHNSNSMTSTFSKRILFNQEPIPNGLACPKCGKELLDTLPNEILTSIPPQKNVGCSSKKCDFTGYRIA